MILGTTTDKLQVVTTTTADIHVITSFADMDDTTKAVTVDRQLTAIVTATTTDILAAPASGTSRKAKWISISNKHASASNNVTLLYDANGTDYEIEKLTLLAGERMSFVEGRGMRLFDANGCEKLASAKAPSGAAGVAQIASHSADTYYLGIPITGRVQAGSFIRWTVKGLSKTAGVATPIFNVRVGTAGTTADTSRAAITLGVQTAVVDQGSFDLVAIFRSVGSGTSAVIRADVVLWHNLLITGFATTPAGQAFGGNTGGGFDSTIANLICGLSVNPGTSGAWVVENVSADGVNFL